MSIHDFPNKIKGFREVLADRLKKHRNALILGGIVLVASGTSFAMGYGARAQVAEASPVVIECPQDAYMPAPAVAAAPVSADAKGNAGSDAAQGSGAYVASKNGKSYYPVSCFAADRIKASNKVYFATEQQAQSAGYKLSGTCN